MRLSNHNAGAGREERGHQRHQTAAMDIPQLCDRRVDDERHQKETHRDQQKPSNHARKRSGTPPRFAEANDPERMILQLVSVQVLRLVHTEMLGVEVHLLLGNPQPSIQVHVEGVFVCVEWLQCEHPAIRVAGGGLAGGVAGHYAVPVEGDGVGFVAVEGGCPERSVALRDTRLIGGSELQTPRTALPQAELAVAVRIQRVDVQQGRLLVHGDAT